MLRLRIIGEGHRDEVCLPPLLRCLLPSPVSGDFKTWRAFHLGRAPKQKGLGQLGRKLLFAIKEARQEEMSGVVATVDHDTGQEKRLQRLRKARDRDRENNPPFPTALGEPKPHLEAWLLDDASAVREALGLQKDHVVPNPVKVHSPKDALHALFGASPAEKDGTLEMDVLPKIAERIDLKRCPHQKETAFQAFIKDVHAEFDAIAKLASG